jgi:predicted metal-dependent hydrolase
LCFDYQHFVNKKDEKIEKKMEEFKSNRNLNEEGSRNNILFLKTFKSIIENNYIKFSTITVILVSL